MKEFVLVALLIAPWNAAALAAPAAIDPVLAAVVKAAAAIDPASQPFEEVTRVTSRDEAGKVETTTRVSRWDGRERVLVSVDGRAATAAERKEAAKAFAQAPKPGYHRLALFLSGGGQRQAAPGGRIGFRISPMPKGSIAIAGDRSGDMVADAVVEPGDRPWVSRLHIFAPKPISMFLVARIDSFDVVNDYALAADGRPMIVRQVQNFSGAQFGKKGSVRTEVNWTPLR